MHIENNQSTSMLTNEGFVDKESVECPISATRTPDGKIQVQPGDKIFKGMNEYLEFLNNIYAKGGTCIPPKVTTSNQPVAGILGGLGTNTESPNSVNMQGGDRSVLDFDNNEQTYAKTEIDKLDDYEYTRVFESEQGIRSPITPESKSVGMNKHVLDWANLPNNAEARAAKEDEFVSGRAEKGFRDPVTGVFFENMEGKNIGVPDMDAVKAREEKLLSAYKPSDISTHTVDNEMKTVAQIVNAAYKNDKNWEPVVTRISDFQWEVTELRPKARIEKYEDEKTKNLALAEERGEALPPPSISIDDRNRDDPYFDKSGVGDRNNNKYWKYEDFRQWTPGLERMFAPTMTTKDWQGNSDI